MSIGSRIKELRQKKGYTQEELAKKIGVTKGAVANYENGVSSPKIELMYRLFDALDCDANYLHQDEIKRLSQKNTTTLEEFEKLVKPYRDLDEHGKDMVSTVLTKEYNRCKEQTATESTNIIQLKEPDRSYLEPEAAHERTDIETTLEGRQHDDDIMNDDSEWE